MNGPYDAWGELKANVSQMYWIQLFVHPWVALGGGVHDGVVEAACDGGESGEADGHPHVGRHVRHRGRHVAACAGGGGNLGEEEGVHVHVRFHAERGRSKVSLYAKVKAKMCPKKSLNTKWQTTLYIEIARTFFLEFL